jgi:hypothetical protein
MTQAFNLALLGNLVNTSGQLNADTGLVNTVNIANGGTNLSTTPANGRLLIGNGTGYTLANLTAASGIEITNASGSISIGAPAAGGPSVQVFTASGTFTVPLGITSVKVTVIGGGGGGTGATTSGCETQGVSGSLGGYCVALVDGLTSGGTIAVTVGGGGAGGAGNASSLASTGAAGGTSSFGTFVTATGGSSTTTAASSGALSGNNQGIGSVSGATLVAKSPTLLTGLETSGVITNKANQDFLSYFGGADGGRRSITTSGGIGGPGMSGGGAGGTPSSAYRSIPGIAYGPGANGAQPAAGVITGGAGGGTGGGAGAGGISFWAGGGGGGAGGVIIEW